MKKNRGGRGGGRPAGILGGQDDGAAMQGAKKAASEYWPLHDIAMTAGGLPASRHIVSLRRSSSRKAPASLALSGPAPSTCTARAAS
ncbi:hypothetical protein G6F55_014454 [Rhizopus delemar]|nr:hypothetical protein G6F55_014454 [Rhizopus delemar]